MLATLNLAHGRGPDASTLGGGDAATRAVRLQQAARLLREHGVDVAVLCEVDFDCFWSGGVDQAALMAAEAGLPFRFELHELQASLPFLRIDAGTAVISRFPLRDPELLPFPARQRILAAALGHKVGAAVTVELGDGATFRLHATHLEHQGERWRIASAEILETWIRRQSMPVIAAGDFNSTQLGFPTPYAGDSPRTAVSILSNADGPLRAWPQAPPSPAQLTFPARSPNRVIDWVLSPPNWQPHDYRALPADFSDHRPVLASFALPPP